MPVDFDQKPRLSFFCRLRHAHQLRAIVPAPAQTYASLEAPPEGSAHTEIPAGPACRLHARVRPHRLSTTVLGIHNIGDARRDNANADDPQQDEKEGIPTKGIEPYEADAEDPPHGEGC
jgi:hypothetical protein